MMRVIAYILGLGLFIAGAVWLANRPGAVTVDWLGWRVETTVPVIIFLGALMTAVFWLLGRFLQGVAGLPAGFGQWRRRRRLTRGLKALVDGFSAVAAGDGPRAQKAAGKAAGLLENKPATRLLRAHADALMGRPDSFKGLPADPASQLLGLRTLFDQATARGDLTAARQHALKAFRQHPQAAWAARATLALEVRNGAWREALGILREGRSTGVFPSKGVPRLRAALLTEMAHGAEVPGDGVRLAREAVGIDGRFVPAVEVLVRNLIRQNKRRRATSVVETAWRTAPHPRLATLWANLAEGEPAARRVARFERLAAANPSHPESRVALAQAAAEAGQWDKARATLGPLAQTETPDPRVARLMARLEEKAGHLDEAVKWLDRAASAIERAPDLDRAAADGAGIVWGREPFPRCPTTGAYVEMAWETPPAEAPRPTPGRPQPPTPPQSGGAGSAKGRRGKGTPPPARKADEARPEATETPAGPANGDPQAKVSAA
ncbi:heme biosynthesis protein HemY [Roseospirillum parvum]|uniref:HemY protein n=1 Tax=Roseospirillum parvum TaxID=83401 RepID=A0A1G7ZUJ0_9PROT|nr:heme biosynthesis HemY N-terminal domain-containing protein [Roseospirillum parvum]SDH12351.1 HemY protein [Roseospirillum parvum]